MITSQTLDLIKKHEGVCLKPYMDSVGKLTIGIGRNLTDCGISAAEADLLLQNDLATAEHGARLLFSNFDQLSEVRQAVLIDMMFNMGMTRFMQFHHMIEAVEQEDYALAAKEMENSTWYTEVRSRAAENVSLFVKGDWS